MSYRHPKLYYDTLGLHTSTKSVLYCNYATSKWLAARGKDLNILVRWLWCSHESKRCFTVVVTVNLSADIRVHGCASISADSLRSVVLKETLLVSWETVCVRFGSGCVTQPQHFPQKLDLREKTLRKTNTKHEPKKRYKILNFILQKN
jgi:hypothetical protein